MPFTEIGVSIGVKKETTKNPGHSFKAGKRTHYPKF